MKIADQPIGCDLGHGPATSDALPLVMLLGRAHDEFAAEFDLRMAESGFADLSLAHSRNVLRHVRGRSTRASSIVERCGVSKQALSQQIAHLERHGYLQARPDPADNRARILILTERGAQAQQLVGRLFTEIEADWADRLGRDGLRVVRALLTDVVTAAAADAGWLHREKASGTALPGGDPAGDR